MSALSGYRPSARLSAYIDSVKTTVEKNLAVAYPTGAEADSIERTYQAMCYMLFLGDGGKRFRPVLSLLISEACAGNESSAWEYAQAVEEIHTYTLILDDIQDRSELRRGDQTCHVRFGTNTALLAAMRLYERGLAPYHRLPAPFSAESRRLLDLLHRGQAADLGVEELAPKELTLTNLQFIHGGKTSALLQLAVLGGLSATRASDGQVNELLGFGYHLGLAYQCRDDVLAVSSSEDVTGKPSGERADLGRLTYPRLLGSEMAAQQEAERLAEEACSCLARSGCSDVTLLCEMAEYAVKRAK